MVFFRNDYKLILKIVLLLPAVFLFLPIAAHATPQFGLGISVNDSDSQLIRGSFRVAPNIKIEGGLGIDYQNVENSSVSDIDNKYFFVGGYGLMDAYDKTQLYYGGKLIYVEYDESNFDGEGYGIAPTVGVEYFFTEHLSIGGEAELYYIFYNGSPNDSKRYGTDSSLIFRYYF